MSKDLNGGGGDAYSVALVADADHVEVDALALELLSAHLGLLDGVGVVTATETAVTGERHKEDLRSRNIRKARVSDVQ